MADEPRQVRICYETLAADGSTLVNVDVTAVNLLLVATNRTLEEEHIAAIAVVQAQVGSGRIPEAVKTAMDMLTVTRTYAATMRRLLLDAERDVFSVDYTAWRGSAPRRRSVPRSSRWWACRCPSPRRCKG